MRQVPLLRGSQIELKDLKLHQWLTWLSILALFIPSPHWASILSAVRMKHTTTNVERALNLFPFSARPSFYTGRSHVWWSAMSAMEVRSPREIWGLHVVEGPSMSLSLWIVTWKGPLVQPSHFPEVGGGSNLSAASVAETCFPALPSYAVMHGTGTAVHAENSAGPMLWSQQVPFLAWFFLPWPPFLHKKSWRNQPSFTKQWGGLRIRFLRVPGGPHMLPWLWAVSGWVAADG